MSIPVYEEKLRKIVRKYLPDNYFSEDNMTNELIQLIQEVYNKAWKDSKSAEYC